MNKYILKAVILIAALFVLSGCAFEAGDSLLAVPKLPMEYVALQQQINKIIASGAQYATAEMGANRQSVQMVDIDADGLNEAIVFFSMGNSTTRAYIFETVQSDYTQVGYIEVYGRRLREVSFPYCDDYGRRAIAISCSYSDAYSHSISLNLYDGMGQIQTMLDTPYTTAFFADANGDGIDELFLALANSVTGSYTMSVYGVSEGKYLKNGEAELCSDIKSIMKMQIGFAGEGKKALFIDSAARGGGYVTDVLELAADEMRNLSMDAASGSGSATWRNMQVYCSDVNEDLITEVPCESDTENKLEWLAFGEYGTQSAATTYHNLTDGWFMFWPEEWGDGVLAERTLAAGTATTVFHVPKNEDPTAPEEVRNVIFSICTFFGESRSEYFQSYAGIRVLATSSDSIYGCYITQNDYAQYTLSEQEIKDAFRVIEKNWSGEK